MRDLPPLELLLLRTVLATCLISLSSFIEPILVVPLITLIHHVLMPKLCRNYPFKFADLVFLPAEMIGFIFFIGSRISERNYTYVVVSCIGFSSLFIEFLIRIASLFDLQLSYPYSAIVDVTSKDPEDLTLYQILLGRSFSTARFNGREPTPKTLAKYCIPIKQARWVFPTRIFLLRIILASCCCSLALAPAVWGSLDDYSWIFQVPIIAVHHLLSCVHLEFEYVFADIPFLVFEIISVSIKISDLGSFSSGIWSFLMACYTVLGCVILAALVLEIGIWTWSIICYRRQLTPSSESMMFIANGIPRPTAVLFGNWLWRTHLSGETHIIRGLRGLIALAILLILFFYAILDLIVSPFQNNNLNPYKDLRSTDIPDSLDVSNVAWSVVFITPNFFEVSDPLFPWDANFQTAVNVTPLWSAKYQSGSSPCAHIPSSGPNVENQHSSQINTVFCPPRLEYVPGERLPSQFATPDLLIKVNFTALNIPVDSIYDTSLNSVKIMIGFHNDTSRVLQTTEATTLVPGTNTLGCTTFDVRQEFKRSYIANLGLSSLGLSDSYETFAVSRMLSIIPDPLASVYPQLIPQAHDISTFRVYLQDSLAEVRTMQRYKEQNTFSGFAAVGGLWTFSSGVFAALFGVSLLRIIFGIKSISLFGIAHSFQRQKIQEAVRREYPKIREEMHQPVEERGLVSLLRDQLINLDFLGNEETKEDLDTLLKHRARAGDVELDRLG